MSKSYHKLHADSTMRLKEPVFAYDAQDSQHESLKSDYPPANTMSVDDYFDELIAQVHKDYANL